MLNRGFTLIEICLVLSVITTLLLITPTLFVNTSILTFESERVKDIIIGAQIEAQLKRQIVNLQLEGNNIVVDEKTTVLSKGIYCDPYQFYFNGKGNINMGNTITCHYLNKEKKIIMNLGNGNIYVK